MIYIEKIKLINQNYPGSKSLNPDFIIECGDVNLFVGDQGVGKSTILNMLFKNDKGLKIDLSEKLKNSQVNSYYFDSEKNNPRVNHPELYTNPNGTNKGIGFGGALKSRFKSHGEVLRSFIIEPLEKAKNSVILLDEPESGLSLTNQYKLVKLINKAVNNGCQFFIATHCLPLIQSFNVISLEHNKIMNGNDFINLIKEKI